MTQTPEERIEKAVDNFWETFDDGNNPEIPAMMEFVRQSLRQTHNNAIQMAMGKVPKELDAGVLDGQVRFGHNTAITQMNKGLSELIIE